MRKQTFLAILLLSGVVCFSQKHTFEIKNCDFLLDNKPVAIHAGELHYARVPQVYWKQRLLILKAIGMNTVSTYVFRNYHHPTPDVWDFKTGNHNLSGFLSFTKKLEIIQSITIC